MVHSTQCIVDTDVAFDDLVAIQCLSCLHSRSSSNGQVNMIAITTVGGVSTPAIGTAIVRKLFTPSVPWILRGQDCPQPVNAVVPEWLSEYRQSITEFCHQQQISIDVDDDNDDDEDNERGQASRDETLSHLPRILEQLQDNSTDLLCLGPLTNLSRWMQCEIMASLLQRKIKNVWIMGGNSIFCEAAKTEVEAEFNFQCDPKAVVNVLGSTQLRDKIRCITLDIPVPAIMEVYYDHLQERCQHCFSANDMYAKMVASYPRRYFVDPICTFAFANPNAIELTKASFQINAETGCMRPDFEGISTDFVTAYSFDQFCAWIAEGVLGR